MYSFITSNKTPELGEALGTVAPNTEPFPFKGCLIKKVSATSSPLGQNVHSRTCSQGGMPAGSCLSKT